MTSTNSSTDRNPHLGSSFDDFLIAEGILEEVTERAVANVAAWQRKRRWGLFLQSALWAVGIGCGLLLFSLIILGTFEALEDAQAPFTVGDVQ